MQFLRVGVGFMLIVSALIAIGFSPQTTSAAEVLVGGSGSPVDYPCTRDGLADAIAAAATTDKDNPGLVTFKCADPTITFSSVIAIGLEPPLQAVTIDGYNSGTPMIFDGNDSTNFFNVGGSGLVILRHLTMTKGFDAFEGGAIDMDNAAEITVTDITFSHNYAHGGGAIDVEGGGKATINQSSFVDNFAPTGGAIEMDDAAEITVTSSIFSHNHAHGGGAISVVGGTATVNQSSFVDNLADTGGAIWNFGDTTINQSSFNHNSTIAEDTNGDDGGAINNWLSLTVNQSSFSNNSAKQGGAISNSALTSELTISQSSFVQNRASDYSGAIDLTNASIALITASTFSNNTAVNEASSIYAHQSTSVTIAWSTIIQPEDEDTPALQIDAGLTAIGVILGGYGSHCAFDGGSLTTPFTISNDSSCGLTGQSLHLGPPSTATVNGVEQTYYPLLAGSPALNAGPPTCDTTVDDDSDSDPDQLGYPRPNIGNCSIGAIESENLPPSIDPFTSPFTIYEGESLTFTVSDTDLTLDSLDSTIDCDTSDLSGPVSGLSCTYPDNGDFSGQIYVSDGYTSNTEIFTVAVTNLAPANVSITPSATLTIVNEPLEIHFSATDVTADTLQFTYNCGDANVLTTPFVSSTTGTFTTSITCQFPQPSSYILHALATDDDGGQSVEVTSVPILVGIPSSLCANNWNGALHMIDDGGECGRSETLIALPWDGPLTLCVNQWNGATHADLHNSGCGRGEQTLTATGAGNIDVCVNQWNGTLRVANRCSRSEYADLL